MKLHPSIISFALWLFAFTDVALTFTLIALGSSCAYATMIALGGNLFVQTVAFGAITFVSFKFAWRRIAGKHANQVRSKMKSQRAH